MGKLSDMPNIGKTLEELLIEAGIDSEEKLKKLGSKETYLTIRKIDEIACFSKLCALEGAIQGIRWHNLSESTKEELKKFFDEVKQK
ncbi:MAG: TfoX/Sxy family protein [Solirubrobacterales bacterium]